MSRLAYVRPAAAGTLEASGVVAVAAGPRDADGEQELVQTTPCPAPIYWIGGSFGGVGKSLVAMAVLDLLLGSGRPAVLVEADLQVADVWKAYHERLSSECVDLGQADGWIDLINGCSERPDAAFVINTPPGIGPAVSKYGTMLDVALEELCRELVGLWVVDRRGVGERLQEFVEKLPRATVHLVGNAYVRGESIGLGEHLQGRRGRSAVLPRLADEVTDALYSRRLSIDRALGELSCGARVELLRWRKEAHRELGTLLPLTGVLAGDDAQD